VNCWVVVSQGPMASRLDVERNGMTRRVYEQDRDLASA
jgi:hypothetical protein